MALTPGTRLGPYEILSSLGAGGMGAVYKARDLRLDRIVAIKVSKTEFSERFKREARTIAQFNHPHICQLYDVGDNYLVMEYVDGKPLKGPLPLAKTLLYAGQICEALDAAHRKGIVHRDLKPGNILVPKSGVKLLDFGLAKSSSRDPGSEETQTLTLTLDGERLGTPHYMAPEQWEGAEADVRSEIYAFGLVVYEMAKGKRPPRHAALEPLEPPALDRLVRTCLALDPDARWQSARDLQHAIESIAHASSHATAASKALVRWPERLVWVAAIALLAGTGYFADSLWHGPPPSPTVRMAVTPPGSAVFAKPFDVTVPVPQFAVAPDGSALVYVAGESGRPPTLWVRPLNSLESRELPGTELARQPFWAPDGKFIAFFAEGALKKIPTAGGPVQIVAEGIPDPRGGTWGSGDTILYGLGNQSIFRVPASGGVPAKVTTLEGSRGEASHRWPYFLPDGQHFLYTVRGSQPEQRGIFVGSLDGAVRKLVAPFDSSAVYSKAGFLIYLDGENLMGRSFDAARLEAKGEPFALSSKIGRASIGNAAVSVSDSGVIAYAANLPQAGSLTWFDRSGAEQGSEGDGDFSDFRLSPDEKLLVTSRFDPVTNGSSIWVTELASHRVTLVSRGTALNASAVWSPDSQSLVYRSNFRGGLEFYRVSATGGSEAQPVLTIDAQLSAGIETTNLVPTDWSADEKRLLFSAAQGPGFSLWTLPMLPQAKAVRLFETTSDELQGTFSPDGTAVAYVSNESGRFEVYVRSLSAPYSRKTISAGGGYEPRWRADGRELYYLSLDRKMMAVAVGAGAAFGAPKALFQTRVPEGVSAFRTHYSPSRSGDRFLVNSQSENADSPAITLETNWTTRAKP